MVHRWLKLSSGTPFISNDLSCTLFSIIKNCSAQSQEYDLPISVKKIMFRQYGNMAKCSTDLDKLGDKKTALKAVFYYYASAVGPPKERGITFGSTSFI